MAVLARISICGFLLFVSLFQRTFSCSHITASVSSSVFNDDAGIKVIARTMEYGYRAFLKHFEFIAIPKKHIDYSNFFITSSLDQLPSNSTLQIPKPIPPSLKIYDPKAELNTYGMVVISLPVKKPSDPTLARFNLITEGQNEKGLSVSLLAFQNSKFQLFEDVTCSKGPEKTLLLWSDVVPYILGSCSTGAEAIAKLEETFIFRPENVELASPVGTGVHFAFDDANGDQYIVEYLNHKMTWYKSDLGIMTNEPDLTWHVRNLDAYAHEFAQKPVLPKEMQFDPPSNMYPFLQFDKVPQPVIKTGIPGDSSARSRFVKLFFLRTLAQSNAPPTTYKEALVLATSLINSVSIPYGSAQGIGDTPTKDEIATEGDVSDMWDLLLSKSSLTHWTVLKVPQKNVVFYRDYEHNAWKEIDLNNLDFSEGADVKIWKLYDKKETFAVPYDTSEGENVCH